MSGLSRRLPVGLSASQTAMPIYAYRCNQCGHSRDVLQKLSDPLLTVCPACSAPAFSKQVTAAGFQLKGSGWYVTDFREGQGRKPEAAAPAPGEAAPAAPAPTGEAAPAAAPAPASSAPAAAASPSVAAAPAAKASA